MILKVSSAKLDRESMEELIEIMRHAIDIVIRPVPKIELEDWAVGPVRQTMRLDPSQIQAPGNVLKRRGHWMFTGTHTFVRQGCMYGGP